MSPLRLGEIKKNLSRSQSQVSAVLLAQSRLTLCKPMELARLPYPWDSLGKNTGVGSHSLLQGIFLTQGLNLDLQHYRQILYHLTQEGSLCCTIFPYCLSILYIVVCTF